MDNIWELYNNSLLVCNNLQNISNKENKKSIACFDLDGTLIVTKSKKRFAVNEKDWKFFNDLNISKKLCELINKNYILVIMSNQNGIGKGKVSCEQIKTKINDIMNNINLPFLILLAIEDDIMRKPRIGMWEFANNFIKNHLNVNIDNKNSFYCGDAAGRKKDFAASDYKFALNIGINFKTPESLFLNEIDNFNEFIIDFDPRTIQIKKIPFNLSDDQEILLLVGSPASGKSSFAKLYCSSYEIICQDELKTISKCKKKCIEMIKLKKNIVIDCTNRNIKSRSIWTTLANEYSIPIRCVVMDMNKNLCLHLNRYRKLYKEKQIPDIAIHVFFKNFTIPSIEEGFNEIINLQFCIDSIHKNTEEIKKIMSFI
jgi:bifunctional polynucleotide phosphatase/kinase